MLVILFMMKETGAEVKSSYECLCWSAVTVTVIGYTESLSHEMSDM